MPYLFTSESVSEGHPDKVADQISDAILDEYLRQDPTAKVACETLVTTDFALVAGEIKSTAHVDAEPIIRETIRRIGYNKPEYLFNADTCEVMNRLHEQSPDINQGVERAKDEDQGAGDQGMMFGYASHETANYMPLALDLSHRLLQELAAIRREAQRHALPAPRRQKPGHHSLLRRPQARGHRHHRYQHPARRVRCLGERRCWRKSRPMC